MAKLEELKALASDLRKRLRQVDQLTGRSNERDYTNVGANIKGIKPLKPKAAPAPAAKPRRKVAYL